MFGIIGFANGVLKIYSISVNYQFTDGVLSSVGIIGYVTGTISNFMNVMV